MKKLSLFVLILSLTVIFSVLTVCASAGDATYYNKFSYKTENDQVTITGIKTKDSDIVIPEKIENRPVTAIGTYAFFENKTLRSVVLPNTIVKLEKGAFASCKKLEEINLPEGLTHLYSFAFSHCTSLTSVKVPESIEFIGSHAFGYCDTLTDITLPDKAFYIDGRAFTFIPAFEEWFTKANDPKTPLPLEEPALYIGKHLVATCLNTKDVLTVKEGTITIASQAICNLPDLTKVIIPDSVKYISGFSIFGCPKLTEVILPEGLEIINWKTFENSTAIEEIKIPKTVTEIAYGAFNGCTSLKELYVPTSVKTIDKTAFENTESLTIKYEGSADMWKEITKNIDADVFKNITVEYNTRHPSETTPIETTPALETTPTDNNRDSKSSAAVYVILASVGICAVAALAVYLTKRKKK